MWRSRGWPQGPQWGGTCRTAHIEPAVRHFETAVPVAAVPPTGCRAPEAGILSVRFLDARVPSSVDLPLLGFDHPDAALGRFSSTIGRLTCPAASNVLPTRAFRFRPTLSWNMSA